MRREASLFVGLVIVGLLGCGQGTDPLTLAGDPTNISPGLSLPLPSSVSITSFTPYGQSGTDGFTLTYYSAVQGQAIAVDTPGTGLVSAVDTAGASVTILHNYHVSSRVTGITPSVVLGTYVTSNQQIGVVSNINSQIRFSVYVNGTAVCPLSYLSPSARQKMYNSSFFYGGTGYNQNPCID
jgi:hypothetical protein